MRHYTATHGGMPGYTVEYEGEPDLTLDGVRFAEVERTESFGPVELRTVGRLMPGESVRFNYGHGNVVTVTRKEIAV